MARSYDQATAKLGAELAILQEVPVEDIARAGSSLLAEAITRLRAGNVIRDPGYDGEYGVIRLFEENELKELTAGGMLFDAPIAKRKAKPKSLQPAAAAADATMPSSRRAAAAARSSTTGQERPHPACLAELDRRTSARRRTSSMDRC